MCARPRDAAYDNAGQGQLNQYHRAFGQWLHRPGGQKACAIGRGRYGFASVEHLAQVLTSEHPTMDAIAFAGAKTKEDLPFEKPLDNLSREIGFWLKEFGRYSISSFVATDDGSAGFKGFVSACILDWLSQNSYQFQSR